jgi:hypothetical protein
MWEQSKNLPRMKAKKFAKTLAKTKTFAQKLSQKRKLLG